MGVSQFCGSFTITSYAATIFKETGSTIDPNLSSIVMGVFQVTATYISSILIDRIGRKILLLISTSGAAMAMLVTGTYVYLGRSGFDVSSFNLLPIISISFFIFICCIGIVGVPNVIMTEILPPKVSY